MKYKRLRYVAKNSTLCIFFNDQFCRTTIYVIITEEKIYLDESFGPFKIYLFTVECLKQDRLLNVYLLHNDIYRL
jgi:hypothetical protein